MAALSQEQQQRPQGPWSVGNVQKPQTVSFHPFFLFLCLCCSRLSEKYPKAKSSSATVSVLTALDTFYETILLREDSLWTRAWRKLTTSTQGNVQVKMMVRKYLNRQLFDAMKRQTTTSGATLMDVLKFYPQFFIVAPDPEAYDVWRALFIPTLSDVMRIGVGLGGAVGGYVFADHDTRKCEKQKMDVGIG